MNYIGLLLIAASMQVSAAAFSQEVTLRLKNVTIERLFGDIRKQTGYNFLYRDEIMEDLGTVSVNVKALPLTTVLDQVLSPKDLRYTILDETILVWKSDSREASGKSGGSFGARQSVGIERPASVGLPEELLSGRHIRQWLVQGVVTDDANQPLPGVSVQLAGTALGTVTDESGAFSIQLPGESATLTFSLLGYRTEERSVSGNGRLTIVMEQDAEALEEAVVIGYGVQRKVNLTGSVAQISPASIEKRTVTQLSQLFGGQVSGVTAPQPSGEPGEAGPVTIRGRGTFSAAGNSPLIIIDGIPRSDFSMNNIDPATIESISVLKDAASASIYGARAANGVILITTKRGRNGFVEVHYSAYGGRQKPTAFPDQVNSWEAMELYNEALTNYGQQPLYSSEVIEKAKSGTDPEFANVDHLRDLFESGNGWQTGHSLNVSGGNEKTRYFTSLGYQRQNGLVRRNWLNRYNVSLNLDQKIGDKVDVALTLQGIVLDAEEPIITSVPGRAGLPGDRTSSVRELASIAYVFPPYIADTYPDGGYTHNPSANRPSILAMLNSESFRSEGQQLVNSSINIDYRLLEGLKLSGRIGYDFSQVAIKRFNSTIEFGDGLVFSPAIMSDDIGLSHYLTSQLILQYQKQWEGHQFLVLGGVSSEENILRGYVLGREGFPNNHLRALSAGASATSTTNGSIEEWSMRSAFGRIQYSFKDRYLAEANLRYDGSSRFSENNRYGFFPSVSLGWRVSEEDFFNVPWISQLKPRFSWGELGNNNVGNYPYHFSISLGQNAVIGSQEVAGAAVTRLPSSNISWEVTRITNVGADFGLFNNKLEVTIDKFRKVTDGVLYQVNTSPFLGLSSSIQNAGKVVNRGLDLQLAYNGRIKELLVRFSPNIAIVRNEVLSTANVDRAISQVGGDYYTILAKGLPMFSFYGFRSDGIFKDAADIENYAEQPYNVTPGDIRYKDISGPQGVPDGKVDFEYDRTVLGSDFPKYTYGGELGLEFRQFDVNVLFQGAAGVRGVLRRGMAMPLNDGGWVVTREQFDGRWTAEDPDPQARVPKVGLGGNSTQNMVSSDFWIVDASYLRVKNIQLGYSFSKSILERLGINQLRLYVNAMNPVSFNSYYKGYDPDYAIGTGSTYYPLTATYSVGVNIQF